QSALLEAMAERQTTIDNVCRPLAQTFLVIATQNPVEHHGPYPLPEAQLDRFAMKLRLGYPGRQDELAMLEAASGVLEGTAGKRDPVLQSEQLPCLQHQVTQVAVGPLVREYLVNLAAAIRQNREVTLGLSPRGLLTWQ